MPSPLLAHEVPPKVGCKPGDLLCFGRLATKAKTPGDGAYPCNLAGLSSETVPTPDGLRITLRLTIHNPTQTNYGPFEVIVSPAEILQGRPVERPTSFLMQVESLAAGAVGVYCLTALVPFPEDGRFHCRDEAFSGTGT